MEDVIQVMFNSRPRQVAILTGLALLVLAILGKIGQTIELSKWPRIAAAVLGAVLMIGGVGLFLKKQARAQTGTSTPSNEQTLSTEPSNRVRNNPRNRDNMFDKRIPGREIDGKGGGKRQREDRVRPR